ncbi:hypothetical protein HKD37_17G048346 [Glycine soja]
MGDNENMKHFADHGYFIEKSIDNAPCKHFSIRGYVARMRKKNLKICSPFPGHEFEAQPSLPPLIVPKFPSWSCNNCRGENELNVIENNDERECCNGNQETQIDNSIPTREEIDIRKFIDLTGQSDDGESDYILFNHNVEVAHDRITDHESDLENNLSKVSNALTSEVCPGLIQEMHGNKKGFEGNVTSGVELLTNNLSTEVKSCSKVTNKEKHIYEDSQCLEQLRKSCKLTGGANMVTEKDNVPKHTTEQFLQEPVTGDNNDHAGDMDNNVENVVQNHHPKKYTHKYSKRPKVMCSLEETFKKDNEPNYQLIRPSGETNTFGERRFPSKSAISGKGALMEASNSKINHFENDDQANSAKNMKQDNVESNNVLTVGNDVPNRVSLVENEVAETLLRMSLDNMENEIAKTLNMKSKERDFDLNIPSFDDTIDQEMLNRDIDLGTSSKTNEDLICGGDNAVELHSNQIICIDLNSTVTRGNDPIHKRILNPGECSNTDMEIDSYRKNFYPSERNTKLLEGESFDKSHGPAIFGRFCGMNRNLAEFTTIEPGNPYMMDKEKVKKSVRKERLGSSSRRNRKSKKRGIVTLPYSGCFLHVWLEKLKNKTKKLRREELRKVRKRRAKTSHVTMLVEEIHPDMLLDTTFEKIDYKMKREDVPSWVIICHSCSCSSWSSHQFPFELVFEFEFVLEFEFEFVFVTVRVAVPIRVRVRHCDDLVTLDLSCTVPLWVCVYSDPGAHLSVKFPSKSSLIDDPLAFMSEYESRGLDSAAQKHKVKRVESVNADAEAFGDHWESSDCSMHSEAEALEHMMKRDRGHQSVSLENKTGDSTVVKMSEKNNNADADDCMILDDHEGEEHCCGKGTNARSVSFLPKSQEKIRDSAKVVIEQDMKGGEHKYGFNNNKREKPEKVRVVDDETGDKHELYEVLRMPSRCDHGFSTCLPSSSSSSSFSSSCSFRRIGFAGIVARDKVDVTYENWKEVPTAQKDLIWEDIQAEFEIPEAYDSRTKRKLLQTMGKTWRQFKSDLTRKWDLAADQDSVEDTVYEKYDISKEKWAQFCQTRRDPSWEDVRKKAQAIQKQNTAPHVLSRGGYDYLEKKLLAEKTKKKLEEAAYSGNVDGVIDPSSSVRRHVKWKMTRMNKTGEMTIKAAKEIAAKIDSFEEQVTQRSFVPHGREDVLTAAIGRPEHPGRVRAAGAGVTIKQYFGSAPETSLADPANQGPARGSQMQSQGLALPPKPLVGPSGPRVSTKGSCVDPSGNDPETGDSDRYGLYIEADPARLVALGRVYEGSTIVHNTPLLLGQVKVGVEEVTDADAPVPVPTDEVAVSSAKPPPKPDPEVDDQLYMMTLTIPELFLRPYQVTWDATVFRVFNPHFPLYIKHEDLSEIAHGGQCLSISVLQLWILIRAGNSGIYGFLEPQSIQRSGQSQFESESYIKTWMQSSKRDVYLGACLNGPDDYLKGIINIALKGLDDAPQPKSKAPARWIVVKYFNDLRPLEPERLKALWIQWAQYYL